MNSGPEDKIGQSVNLKESLADDSQEVVIAAGFPIVGTVFAGKYEVIALVGVGGMSKVFKARDTLVDRIVAIKVLMSSRLYDATNLYRFRQEARAAAHLQHPNIVQIHEFNVPPEGPPYIVMDFVEGRSLSDVIESQGRLPYERWLPLMRQIGSALQHAHERGIVHRDLKPSNIILSGTGDHEAANLIDFGIAKISVAEGNQAALTQTGEVFGSPNYMSPEQCLGQKVDLRTDIYSFGCVMYETLTGKKAIEGDSLLETMNKHVTGHLSTLGASCPELENFIPVENIIFKTMARNPEDRYQSAAEVESDLMGLGDSPMSVVTRRAQTPFCAYMDAIQPHVDLLKGLAVPITIAGVLAASVTAFVLSGMNSMFHQPDLPKQEEKGVSVPPASASINTGQKDKFAPYDVYTMKLVADTHAANKEYEQADKLYTKALALSDKTNGADSKVSAYLDFAKAMNLLNWGKPSTAADCFKMANHACLRLNCDNESDAYLFKGLADYRDCWGASPQRVESLYKSALGAYKDNTAEPNRTKGQGYTLRAMSQFYKEQKRMKESVDAMTRVEMLLDGNESQKRPEK